MSEGPDSDRLAVREVIRRQFASLGWSPDRGADWDAFRGDFLPGAALYPSSRPVGRLTPEAFVERMQGLAGTTLRTFEETVLGTEIRVFGNIAVATASCEAVENGSEASRSVEMMLLVKDGGRWRIAAQCWDKAGEASPVPDDLLAGGDERQ